MFYEATSFKQPLNNWNVSNVTNMNGFLRNVSRENQGFVINFIEPNWNISSCISFKSIQLI